VRVRPFADARRFESEQWHGRFDGDCWLALAGAARSLSAQSHAIGLPAPVDFWNAGPIQLSQTRDEIAGGSPIRERRLSTSDSSLLAPSASSAARSVIAGDRARVYPVLQWDACWKQATSYCATTFGLPEFSPPMLVGFA
jgi:hypothetical protein